MAQYLLSVWHDAEYEMDFSTPEARRLVGQVGAFNAKLEEAGAWVFGAGLQPASSATVVRPGSGSVSMTDGPYAETKEQMGGGSGSSRPRTSTRPWSGPDKRPPRPRGRWSCAPCRMNDELAALYRREVGRCTATLVRVLGDLDLAEDAVAEAFAIAAERWPVTGIPPNPGGWITTTARNRSIDRLRREATRADRHLAASRLHHDDMRPDDRLELDRLDDFVDVVADDQLRLMFLCCHPALGPDAQVALTLRLLGGLEVPEIAGAFLVATMAQRLVRAKRKLRNNHAPYRIPDAAELPDRLHPVLNAIALVFNEGHTATSGDGLVRTDLGAEAIRLGRVLVELMPDEPEVLGLLALMLLTDARRPARVAADGSMVRLADQDRSRWDLDLVAEGHALVRACLRRNQPGPFQI